MGRSYNCSSSEPILRMSYFHSSMDEDSKLLASAGLPVFTFLLTQRAAFSLSTLFSLSLADIGWMFTKYALGMRIPQPRGEHICDYISVLLSQGWGMAMI